MGGVETFQQLRSYGLHVLEIHTEGSYVGLSQAPDEAL
jgi:hypothetical protein